MCGGKLTLWSLESGSVVESSCKIFFYWFWLLCRGNVFWVSRIFEVIVTCPQVVVGQFPISVYLVVAVEVAVVEGVPMFFSVDTKEFYCCLSSLFLDVISCVFV